MPQMSPDGLVGHINAFKNPGLENAGLCMQQHFIKSLLILMGIGPEFIKLSCSKGLNII